MKRLQIMLTQKCNSNCSYCMVSKNNEELDEKIIDNLLEIINQGNFDIIMLFGGEPLLREDLCYAIKEKIGNTKIMLPTNGKLLTDKHIQDFGNILISSNGTEETCKLTGQTYIPEILNLVEKDKCTIGMRIIPESAQRMKEDFNYFFSAGFLKYNIVPIIEMDWNNTTYKDYRQGVQYILSKISRDNIWTWKKGGICVPYNGTTCIDQTGKFWGCSRLYSDKLKVSSIVKDYHFQKCFNCNIRDYCFHNCYYLNQIKTGSIINPYKGICKFAELYKEILQHEKE